MKKIKSIVIAATMMVAGTTASFAQEKGHSHGSPHGGIVKTAGDYHVEMVMAKGKATFYLLDDKEKSMTNKGITGTVLFQFADKTTATVPLTASGDAAFLATNEKVSTFKSCVVTFKVNGKTVTAKFTEEKAEHKKEEHKESDGHQHQH